MQVHLFTQVTTGFAELEVAREEGLVEIGGRLPTATQLHQAFIKNPLKAFSRQQEGEFCLPATVKYYFR